MTCVLKRLPARRPRVRIPRRSGGRARILLRHDNRRPVARESDVTPPLVIPHGTIRLKKSRSVITLKRETVAGDPARDTHSDRSQLIGAYPCAREPLDAFAPQAEVSRCSDHHLFEIADVPVHVATIGAEVHDRVSDDLPWPVIRDVAAAARLVHGDRHGRRACPESRSGATGQRRAWRQA